MHTTPKSRRAWDDVRMTQRLRLSGWRAIEADRPAGSASFSNVSGGERRMNVWYWQWFRGWRVVPRIQDDPVISADEVRGLSSLSRTFSLQAGDEKGRGRIRSGPLASHHGRQKRWNNNKTKDWGPMGRCRIVGSLATGGLAKYPLAYWAGLLLPSDSSGVLVAIKLVSVYRQSLRRRKSPVVEISPFLLVFESWSDLSVQLRAFSLLDILLYFASRRTLLPKRLWYSQWRRRYRLLSTRSSPDGRYMSLSHTRIGAGENAKGVDWYRMP